MLQSTAGILSIWVIGFVFCLPVWSEAGLQDPVGRVILDVVGKIEQRNTVESAQFDAETIAALPQYLIKTTTPWTDGMGEFSGPRFLDLLEKVSADARKLTLPALNDYQIEIPLVDLQAYPVILATHLNGKRLRVRDRGPLWVIYPWSDFKELQTETYYRRSIWQVKKILVE